MVKLGNLGYGGIMISRIWWNYDIYDMVELGYLGYGGTMISRICLNYDTQVW